MQLSNGAIKVKAASSASALAAKAEEAQARDPYSQLKPSPTAGMDNGSMSVSDFRKMFKG